jgi:hypothetical protein
MKKTIPLYIPVIMGILIGSMLALMVITFELVIVICLALISTELIHGGAFVAGIIATIYSIFLVFFIRHIILSLTIFLRD